MSKQNVLIAYYSHAGDTYVNGKIKYLEVGNTKVVAKKIQEILACDSFEIQALKVYPKEYEECTKVAKEELENNIKVKLVNSIDSIASYDTILLGYPNWWGTMPLPVQTFLAAYDFSNKDVYPFCTHEGSGMGNSIQDIQKLLPQANVKNGLAIKGSSVADSEQDLRTWLQAIVNV